MYLGIDIIALKPCIGYYGLEDIASYEAYLIEWVVESSWIMRALNLLLLEALSLTRESLSASLYIRLHVWLLNAKARILLNEQHLRLSYKQAENSNGFFRN